MSKKCPFINDDCMHFDCALFLPEFGKDNKRYGKCAFVITAEASRNEGDITEPINIIPST